MPVSATARRTPLPVLLHTLFFVLAATQTAIVPLLPRLSHTYGLTPTSSALLLAAPGVATLAISLPAGLFADRLGARRLTVSAAGLAALSAVAQAMPSYPMLVAGRLAFGLAFGMIWTTGVAWLSSAHGEAGSPRLGAVATSAAVGMTAGPALGGVLTDQLGVAAPFALVAGLTAILAAMLWRQPGAARVPTLARDALAQLARHAPRSHGVVNGACVLAITGAVGGVTQLLVPLVLHGAGFSASATGVVFSASAGVYIVVSAAAVRLGRRVTTVRATAMAGLALALSLLPAALSASTVVVIAVLLISTAPRAVASTVAYPLATDAAALSGLGDGVVIGLLNGTWAMGLVLAPLVAGFVDQGFGPQLAFASTVAPGVLIGLWLLVRPVGALSAAEPAVAGV
ncbi:MAG: MFS transporter [Actinomycetota bacterium]|nr:MFS transporter [Actinomycetota bacterium]